MAKKDTVSASDAPEAAIVKVELTKKGRLFAHLATALGLIGLGAWYLIAEATGFLDWVVASTPDDYKGAGLMVAIMAVMAPGLFIWNRFQRVCVNYVHEHYKA